MGVGDDGAGGLVVDIAKRWNHWPDAFLEFLTLAATDIFGEIIAVIFRLVEHVGKVHLARCGRVEIEGRETQILDDSDIDKPDDPTRIDAVSGKTVRMPSQNALCLSFFKTIHHGIENRPAGTFGGLLFDENLSDLKVFPDRHFPKLGNLVVDAPYLAGQIVSGFAGVEKILEVIWGIHIAIILARKANGAKN